MSAFSQLKGHTSLPHGGQAGLSVDWSDAAFSQLNTFDFFGDSTQKTRPLWAWAFSQLNAPRDSALVCGRSPVFSTAPFSQLNGHAAQVPGGQVSPRIDRVGSAFSQLNAWSVSGHANHATSHPTSGAAFRCRVFSQLNARGHAPIGQARKNVFARAAFSQLNALGLVASSTCCSALRSRPNPVPHRPDFRGLKPRAYLHTTHEPRTTRGSVHLEPGIWRNRMK